MIEWQDSWYWPRGGTRTLHIYLPDWYYDSNERLPVTYFFDGHNLFFDEHATYGRSWRLARFLDRWEKPMIVVGIECSHEGDARLDEYSPYRKRLLGHNVLGLGEDTFQWIIGDVKPSIDEQYRTWPHREATGIAGSSMGGLMSLYGAICHNATFGKSAVLSAGLRFNRKELLRDLNSANISADTRVYLSWGEHESGRIYRHKDGSFDPYLDSAEAHATNELALALGGYGVATMTYCQQNGRHREADWERQIPLFMDFLWLDRRW